MRLHKVSAWWSYVFLVVCMVGFAAGFTNTQNRLVTFCHQLQTAHASYNKTLDALIANSLSSTVLTPAQKVQRIQQFAPLHLATVSCPRPFL